MVLAVVTTACALPDRADALPDRALVSAVPVSTREVDDAEVGNKIANMFVALPVQVEDAVERLHLIHESTTSAKR